MIEAVSLDRLHLDPANARRHPARNVESIKASLARFGQQTPVVVDRDDIVRDGNGTVMAARELRWRKIWIQRTELAGAEATAYAIAANRTAELAEWDLIPLATKLKALESDGLDLGDVGFTELEVEDLLETITEAALAQAPDEDDVERPRASDPILRRPLRYELVFETQTQSEHWYSFVRWLLKRPEYDAETIAGRLDWFLSAQDVPNE